MSQGCKALVGLAASAHQRCANQAGSCKGLERRAKSAGRSSARRQGERTEETRQSEGMQNLPVQPRTLWRLGRWRSTAARKNCQRRPGKPTALQAGCSCRNNQGGLRVEWEQAPGAMGSKAWSAGPGGNNRLPGWRSGSRAGASASSGHGIWNHDRKRAASPGQSPPIER